MRRCKHATVFRLCRASRRALRAPMFESQRDSSVEPKVGCVADYLGSTFKSSTTPKRVAYVFGARLCAEHQPQHSGGPNASQTDNRCGWSCRHSRAPTKGPDTTLSELLFLFGGHPGQLVPRNPGLSDEIPLGFSIRRSRASFLSSRAESPADDICPIRSHITG